MFLMIFWVCSLARAISVMERVSSIMAWLAFSMASRTVIIR